MFEIISKYEQKILSCLSGAALVIAIMLLSSSQASALAGSNTVDSGDIINGQVTNADIADGTIRSLDIGFNTITAPDIAANAVGNQELADDITVNTLIADTISVNNLFNTQFLNLGASVVTSIPANGDGTAASFTLDSTQAVAYLGLDCQDVNGCNVTMGEDFIDGDVIYVYNAGTNTINFADTSGVSELAGAYAMGQWDTLQLIFRDNGVTESWLEFSRSNN